MSLLVYSRFFHVRTLQESGWDSYNPPLAHTLESRERHMGSVLLSDFPKAARRETETSHDALRDMIQQFTDMVTQIHFPLASSAPTAGLLTTTLAIEIADANDVKALFGDNAAGKVQVDITGGTAAGATVTGSDGVADGTAVEVLFDKGAGSVIVTATGTGTVILGLTDSGGSGLAVTDTITVTFS